MQLIPQVVRPQCKALSVSNLQDQSVVFEEEGENATIENFVSSTVDLSTAMSPEVIQPLLNNSEFLQQLSTLVPQTPGAEKNAAEEVKSTVQSPQFQQAMGLFSAALQSGQLGPLMKQFGMNQDIVATATSGGKRVSQSFTCYPCQLTKTKLFFKDMEAFVKALQNDLDAKSKKEDNKPEKKEDKDEDEGMSLD